jgi:uncharacterized membrane protein
MKITPITYVVITTIILFSVTIMAVLGASFGWVFFLTVIGQILLVFTVLKVLKDDYTTDKTFDHFYEDRPVEPIEVKAKNEKFR